MAQQTINVGAAPNDGTGTPLRTAFQYTNSNFSELYTAVGPSGNNIVVPGNATITGDLTVDTSTLKVDSTNNRVGIGLASGMTAPLEVQANTSSTAINIRGRADNSNALRFYANDGTTQQAYIGADDVNIDILSTGGRPLRFFSNSLLQYQINPLGVFTWYDGAGGTRMTLNSTGLGVGVAPAQKLTVLTNLGISASTATAADDRLVFSENMGSVNLGSQIVWKSAGTGNAYASIGITNGAAGSTGSLIFSTSSSIFGSNNVERLRIDSSGNVGIGVTPSVQIGNYKSLQIGIGGNLIGRTDDAGIELSSNAYRSGSGSYIYLNTDNSASYRQYSGTHQWFTAPSGTAGNAITFTQAMTLDASGRLLVGQTSTGILNINGIDIEGGDSNGGSYIIVNHKLATASGQQYLFFGYNAVKTGDITQNGTTGVLYNTVSDYRLKESVQPLSNGLSRVSALKPSIYKWKSDGSSGEGFLAHELAEVVPFAVTGEKDALNEDGSVKAQSVDMSRVIPILVAAIQELTARVQTLETR